MNDKAVETIIKIKSVIATAERWNVTRLMSEGQICIAALRDIQRIIKESSDE